MAFKSLLRYIAGRAESGDKESSQFLGRFIDEFPEHYSETVATMYEEQAKQRNGHQMPMPLLEAPPLPEEAPVTRGKQKRSVTNRRTDFEREQTETNAPPGFLYCINCRTYKKDAEFSHDQRHAERRYHRLYCRICSSKLRAARRQRQQDV